MSLFLSFSSVFGQIEKADGLMEISIVSANAYHRGFVAEYQYPKRPAGFSRKKASPFDLNLRIVVNKVSNNLKEPIPLYIRISTNGKDANVIPIGNEECFFEKDKFYDYQITIYLYDAGWHLLELVQLDKNGVAIVYDRIRVLF